ncbi:diguanylate cyclase [Gilvimarinus sp. DA14]|uniref:sensor domain-containing diguanylate cyclase n=1 Tax=Gilvimarinus sp. DA14 TaxID=2956798 RepID=UPI0020B8DAFE|nr:diguanylate cyclase [Gilvimarinus sp. DA14]UTF58937.1 diguanylate cyclase [Gilvimarinus sp. DA14]
MINITPAVRLSFGLVVLTVSILLFADALGLTPDAKQKQIEGRQNLSQALAFQTLVGYSRSDRALVEQLLQHAVQATPELKSAAVYPTGNRDPFVVTAQHQSLWPADFNGRSTPEYVNVPLTLGERKVGELQLVYQPLVQADASYWGLPRTVLLGGFIVLAGFVSYRLFIGRALRHLDPSAVVPARVRNALNVLAEGVFILDRREHIVLVNTILLQRLGVSEKQLLGRKAGQLQWRGQSEQLPWSQALQSGDKVVAQRLTLVQGNGNTTVFNVNAVPIMDGKGATQGVIASFDDVSELEHKNQQLEQMLVELARSQSAIEEKNRELEHMAAHDALTNCLNRRALREQLERLFTAATTKRTPLCCIMLDIDHFKRINDTYGHSQGDTVIQQVAERVRQQVRQGDLLARFGGEEFCILLPDSDSEQSAKIAERCRELIAAEPIEGVNVSCSFGVAFLMPDADSPNDLIQHADEALYYSKQGGRNRVTVWNPGIRHKMKAFD